MYVFSSFFIFFMKKFTLNISLYLMQPCYTYIHNMTICSFYLFIYLTKFAILVSSNSSLNG